MDRKLNYTVIMVLLITLFSCGYHFTPGGNNIDKTIKRVYIGTFSNATSEAYIENYIRNAFIDEFRKGSRFNLAANRQTADAYLSGSITDVSTAHLSYTSDTVASEDRVTVTIEAAFKDKKNEKTIWKNKSLSEREAYVVSSNPATTDRNRKAALVKASEDLAKGVYRNIMSGF